MQGVVIVRQYVPPEPDRRVRHTVRAKPALTCVASPMVAEAARASAAAAAAPHPARDSQRSEDLATTLRRPLRLRSGRSAGAGWPDAAVRSRRATLSSCPPDKTAAMAKVRSMLAEQAAAGSGTHSQPWGACPRFRSRGEGRALAVWSHGQQAHSAERAGARLKPRSHTWLAASYAQAASSSGNRLRKKVPMSPTAWPH